MSVNFREDKTWLLIEAKLKEMQERSKNKIADESTTYKDVLFHRGRIAVARELLALPNLETITATKR